MALPQPPTSNALSIPSLSRRAGLVKGGEGRGLRQVLVGTDSFSLES